MTEDDRTLLERALAPLRVPMRADGADLELVGVADGVVRVRLVLSAETCSDCVLPADMLRSVLLAGLAAEVPGVTDVVVEDPRSGVHPARR